MHLQDNFFDFDQFTELSSEQVFKFELLPPRAYEKDPNLVVQVSFEVNLDLRLKHRFGYTVLDLLSDIGGVTSILYTFFGFLLSVWNY